MRATINQSLSWAALSLLAACVAFSGCGRGSNAVATYRSGKISADDLQRRILCDPKTRGGPQKGEPRDAWEERMVRRMVLERLLVPKEILEPHGESLLRPGPWRTLVVNTLMEREGMRRVAIPDDSLRAYYDVQWADFYVPEGVVFQHVFIPCNVHESVERVQAKARADSVAMLAASGVDFGELVSRFSLSESRTWGGRVGTMFRGQLPPEVEGVVFGLAPGETSKPLATEVGYHVFKVIERKDGYLPPFEDVSALIRRSLTDRELESMKREYLKALADDLPVAINPDAYYESNDDAAIVLRAGDETVTKGQLAEWLGRFGKANLEREELEQVLDGIATDARMFMKAHMLGLDEDPLVVERFQARRAGDYVDSVLSAAVFQTEVGESPLRRHFQEHSARFLTRKTWSVREITIDFGDDRYEAWTRALEVAARAQRGEDFATLARTYSSAPSAVQGGDLGPVPLMESARRGPEFQKLLLSLDPGTVSDPVPTSRSYLILKLDGIDEPAACSFEEAIDAVRRDYLAELKDSLAGAEAREILSQAEFRYHGVQE